MLRFDERVHLPKNRENTITFLVNGEPIGTVETLAPGAKTVDIPIPPVDYDSVTDALGYIPYDSSNPSGYITSTALTNYVTTNTNQTITAVKSFHNAELLTDNFITLNGTTAYLRGQSGINYYNLMNLNNSGITVGSVNQPIKLAGNATRPKYNSNDLALYSDVPSLTNYLENTATGSESLTLLGTVATNANALNIGVGSQATTTNSLALGDYASAEQVGAIAIYSSENSAHRARANGYGSIAIGRNALAINANYNIAIGDNAIAQNTNSIQLGNGQNTASNTFQVMSYKLLDTSTGLIPDARISSNIARLTDIPTIPEEVFIAEYGTTTFQEVLDAYNAGKAVYAKRQVTSNTYEIFSLCVKQSATFWFSNAGGINSQHAFISPQTTVYTLDAQNTWDIGTFTNASNTLSNVTAIDASSAVQTALDDKVSKSGDTMTGGLQINKSTTDETGNYYINLSSVEYDSAVATNIYPHILTVTDVNNDVIGDIEYAQQTNGNQWISLQAHNVTSNTYSALKTGFDANGDAYCEFPDTKRVDGQWVFKSTELASGVTWNASSHSDAKDYSLSSYLPNDGRKYEVLIRANGTTTSTSGKFIRVGLTSDIITTQTYACACRTRTASTQNCAGSVILPVSTGRKISVAGTTDTSSDGTYGLRALGYRRIGLNS